MGKWVRNDLAKASAAVRRGGAAGVLKGAEDIVTEAQRLIRPANGRPSRRGQPPKTWDGSLPRAHKARMTGPTEATASVEGTEIARIAARLHGTLGRQWMPTAVARVRPRLLRTIGTAVQKELR